MSRRDCATCLTALDGTPRPGDVERRDLVGKVRPAMQPTAGTPRDPNNFGKQWRTPGRAAAPRGFKLFSEGEVVFWLLHKVQSRHRVKAVEARLDTPAARLT